MHMYADASRHQSAIPTAGAVRLNGLPCLPYRRKTFDSREQCAVSCHSAHSPSPRHVFSRPLQRNKLPSHGTQHNIPQLAAYNLTLPNLLLGVLPKFCCVVVLKESSPVSLRADLLDQAWCQMMMVSRNPRRHYGTVVSPSTDCDFSFISSSRALGTNHEVFSFPSTWGFGTGLT